ncbi:peptidoglycan DD-metalloendopeptidase family protein [Ornithinibacillus bavariensis]|uniref:peptidoglycan DD-metalloendopeptidase family protein n=1 Tax=Ornithinibacillus bavariensis TaxID=545502 RepID=UPI003D23418B
MIRFRKTLMVLLTILLVIPTFSLKPEEASAAATFIRPSEGTVTSGFGPRWGSMHYGVDIAKSGTVPVVASAPGTVIFAGQAGTYGNVVYVHHQINGVSYVTVYAHLRSISVRVNDVVSQGQRLGYMGETGNAQGQHVHFELHKGTSTWNRAYAVDPMDYFDKNIVPVEEGSFRLLTGTFSTVASQQEAAERLRQATGWTVYTVNENGLRLKTGTFTTRASAEAGQRLITQQFGWVSYIKQEYFRLLTGTFNSTAEQNAAYERLRNDTGWTVYKVNENGLRLKTGTFKTRTAVEQAQQLVTNDYGWITYIQVEEQ